MAKKKIKLEEVKPAEVKGLLRDVPLENPVELTSVTRFSADHILRTSYNPTSKAVVLEDVPAGLKSEFTLGESGGGISNPILTINCINSINPTVFLVYIIEDGILKHVEDVVDPDETKAVETIAIYDGDWGKYLYYFAESGEGTVSDLSNCTVDNGMAIITDPTEPASFTFTIVDQGA